MLRIVSCSSLRVQLQYSLGRIGSSSLSPQLCVCPSVPPTSFTQQQSSTCRGKTKIKISTWKLCRAVRSGQQTLVLAMQSTEPVCRASRYSLSCSCQGWLCTGMGTCIHGRGEMMPPWPERGGRQMGDQDTQLLSGTCCPLCQPGSGSCREGQGTCTALSPLTELSLLSCSVSRLF